MQKLTKDQAVVLSGFTGILMCKFSDFHEDVEKRLGRPVFTHEFGSARFKDNLKILYRGDFMEMVS